MSELLNRDFPDWIVEGGDTRNVVDHYKYWTDQAIKDDLRERSSPLEVVAENFAHDFNIASLIRNANAFNTRGVTVVGRRGWDKRGAVGTQHYTRVQYEKDAEAYYTRLVESGVSLVVVDNIPGSLMLPEYEWPSGEVAVVFGQEDIGVSNLAITHATAVVAIPQFGTVRSINVASAGAIVLYDYFLRGPKS